jgi:hypothetical protein
MKVGCARAHCTAAESGMCSCGLHSRPSSVPFQVRLRALVGVEGGGEQRHGLWMSGSPPQRHEAIEWRT